MTLKIIKTTDPIAKPSVNMLVYGPGGVGKTTFASTAPKPLLLDCEDGAKYFGLRGINMDRVVIRNWSDLNGIFDIAKSGDYKTIIIDPVGELMEKLKRFMIEKGDKKLVQGDGSPSMAGWGWLKETMRNTLKILKESGVHLIIIAHVAEDKDEDKIVRRPMMLTKLSEELVNMVDVVGFMTIIQDADGNDKRLILVDPTNEKYVAKDRTGQLGKYIPPQFQDIIDACQGNKTFSWSNAKAVTTSAPAPQEEAQEEAQSEEESPESEVESKANEINERVANLANKKRVSSKK
jgi:phage nucleotide-binding protein